MRRLSPRFASLIGTTTAMFALPALVHAQAVDPNKQPPTEAVAQPTQFLHLLNLETPEVLAKRQALVNLDIRPFGSKEDLTYVFLEGMYGISDRLTGFVRGGGSMRRYYRSGLLSVPHGGQEYEVGARYGLPAMRNIKLGLEGSVLYDNTLYNNKFIFGGQAMASSSFLQDKLVAYLSPRVFLADSSYGTFGGGLTYQISNEFALLADGQLVVFGNNATRVGDNARIGQEVWGVGFRYAPTSLLNGKVSLELGIGNGLGRTSSFSASPGLSGSASAYINVGYKL